MVLETHAHIDQFSLNLLEHVKTDRLMPHQRCEFITNKYLVQKSLLYARIEKVEEATSTKQQY